MAAGYLSAKFETNGPLNELTFGAGTFSTKLAYFPLISFSFDPKVAPLMRDDELRNIDDALAVQPEDYAPEFSMELRAYPDTLAFLFKWLFGAPVTTAGDGIITDPDTITIPATATRHVWTAPFTSSSAFPTTCQLTIAYGTESSWYQINGAAITGLEITSPESGGVRVKVSGMATYLKRLTSDPSLTPAYDALTIPPWERGNLKIATWLASTAETEDFSIKAEQGVDAFNSLGVASKFPDVIEKGDAPIIVSGSIPKRRIAAADWDALIAATGFAAKANWKSTVNIAATSYPYQFWIQHSNAQYVGGSLQDLANRRRIGASFDFKATNAGSASSTITLVNATTSYA